MAGQIWLVRLVIGVIYFFGIKRAVGAETISEFFHAIRINTHVASSPNAIGTIRKKIEELVIAYGKKHQKEGFQKSGILYVIGGVDETFFRELMVLVLLDLPTGYILMEEVSNNRTYTTWSEKINAVLSNLNVEIRYLVSDRAPALIKLATDYFECSSIADIFHALHKIAQTFSLALRNKLNANSKKLEEIEKELLELGAEEEEKRKILFELKDQISKTVTNLKNSYQRYRELLRQFSLIVHPFNIESNEAQSSSKVEQLLRKVINELVTIAKKFDLKYKKLDSVKNQISDIASLIDIWWDWVNSSLSDFGLNPETERWATEVLLPFIYWQKQIGKSSSKEINDFYRKAYQEAKKRLALDVRTKQIDGELRTILEAWADKMVGYFCRASSAVEGHNGTLSQLNHCRRGLGEKRLPVLTVIHNFDLRRASVPTAAERFFGREFPNLFEWILSHPQELPLPRASRSAT